MPFQLDYMSFYSTPDQSKTAHVVNIVHQGGGALEIDTSGSG